MTLAVYKSDLVPGFVAQIAVGIDSIPRERQQEKKQVFNG